MKEIVAELILKEVKLEKEKIKNLIEIPPTSELGDFAFPCFSLAKTEKKSPLLIAENLAEKLRKKLPKEISNIDAKAGYVNFFINKKILVDSVLKEILKKKEKFGSSSEGKGKTIVLDMSSPNIAKPFGIGHLRSTIIGNSISEISKKLGYKTVKINYLGDWGTQFGKLIFAYKKWGNEKELKKDPINYLLKLYVKSNDEQYEQNARDEFKKLEQGDKQNLELWKKFKDLSLKEFNKIYKIMNIKFDEFSGESVYNNKMESIIKELEKNKLLEESEGAQIVNLEKYNLGVCLIKKSDNTTLYATRDLTAAIDRYKKYKFSKMIYEVGQEQKLHFQQIFKILELLGYNFAKNCTHVYHGLYLDEDGKKFATRKGKTVFMSDILEETIELAEKIIQQKNPNLKNKKQVAEKVAIAAIFYGDLKNHRTNDLVFNIDKFLEFDGNTGPYLLYSYARANSIIKKVKNVAKSEDKIQDLKEHEINLVKKLSQFPEIIQQAYNQLSPNLIANYTYELAQIFNEFYHECPVLGSGEENFRLNLVKAFQIVMKSSLNLLGIQEVEEM